MAENSVKPTAPLDPDPRGNRRTLSRITIASLIWAGSILLSRVIGIVREGVIGRTIGATSEADVYWAAFIIPDWLNYLLAGGALSLVLIPIIAEHLEKGDEKKSWETVRVVLSFLTITLVMLVALIWHFAPQLTRVVAPGFQGAQAERLTELLRIILPAQYFHITGGVLSAALQAREQHKLPAAAPPVYTLSIVAGGLIGGAKHGASGFAWGVLVGSFLGPFLLPLIGCVKAGMRVTDLFGPLIPSQSSRTQVSFRTLLTHRDLSRYLWLSLPVMLAFSIVAFDDWITRREASVLSVGAVSVLTYAKTLMRVPMAVFGLASGLAAYPILSRLVAAGKPLEMYRTLHASIRGVLILALASQAVLTVAGFEIAAVVYGRGRISTVQLHDLRLALAVICIGLPGWAISNLLSRGFYALGKTWVPSLLGSAVTLVAYPLYYFGARTNGILGLAAASSVGIIVYVLLVGWALKRDVKPYEYDPRTTPVWLVKVFFSLVLSIAAGLALDWFLPPSIDIDSTPLLFLRGCATGSTALVVYFLSTVFLRVEESRAILARLIARVRTRTA